MTRGGRGRKVTYCQQCHRVQPKSHLIGGICPFAVQGGNGGGQGGNAGGQGQGGNAGGQAGGQGANAAGAGLLPEEHEAANPVAANLLPDGGANPLLPVAVNEEPQPDQPGAEKLKRLKERMAREKLEPKKTLEAAEAGAEGGAVPEAGAEGGAVPEAGAEGGAVPEAAAAE